MGKEATIRIALAGLGEVAEHHLRAYAELEAISIVAGADTRKERVCSLAQQYRFKAYGDVAEMLAAEKPDLLCVLTPPVSHRDVCELAARAGVHVLCEKPLAPTIEDSLAIRACCESHGTELFYGASYRYLGAVRKARELIKQGVLGEVRLMSERTVGGTGADQLEYLDASHYSPGAPGGTGMGLVDHGIHMLDAFTWLIDSPTVSVWGQGNIAGAPARPEFVSLAYANGTSGVLIYDEGTFPSELPGHGVFGAGEGWNSEGVAAAGTFDAQPVTIQVHGSEGALQIYPYAHLLYLRDRRGLRQVTLTTRPPPFHFRAQMQTCVDYLLGSGPRPPDADAGIAALQIVYAVQQASATGAAVDPRALRSG